MDILKQNEFILYGKGKISNGILQEEVSFEIEYNPFKVSLRTSRVRLGQLYSIGHSRLEGTIVESGLKVECESLSLSNYSKYQLSFGLLNDLIIGNELNFKLFKANLFGFNIQLNDFKIDEYLLSTKTVENIKEINSFNKIYGDMLESSEILIKKIDSTSIDKKRIIEFCNDVCLLLALIQAKNIVFNRCQLIDDNGDLQNIIRIKLVNHNYGKRFVYNEQIELILPVLYENFIKLNPVERKCLYTSIQYLNSSSGQFLEDSILSVAQVWEILSDTFLSDKVENTQNINALRIELKSTIKQWHKSNEVVDYDLGFITGRVLDSLNWEKVIKRLEQLAVSENLNSELIGLNFKELISIRNQIAHSGRFKEIGFELEYLKVYNSALMGANILILKKLGYKGNITFFIGGIPKTRNIDSYLN